MAAKVTIKPVMVMLPVYVRFNNEEIVIGQVEVEIAASVTTVSTDNKDNDERATGEDKNPD